MSYAYHYYAGADGAQFCYAAQPTYRCPLAEPSEEGAGRPNESSQLVAAADALTVDPGKLAGVLKRAHASYRAGRERTEEGRLTDTCRVCGARMERVGFAAWHQAPDPVEYRQQIAKRLGYVAATRQVGRRRYFDRKREAMEWAHEEAKISRAAAQEGVR